MVERNMLKVRPKGIYSAELVPSMTRVTQANTYQALISEAPEWDIMALELGDILL